MESRIEEPPGLHLSLALVLPLGRYADDVPVRCLEPYRIPPALRALSRLPAAPAAAPTGHAPLHRGPMALKVFDWLLNAVAATGFTYIAHLSVLSRISAWRQRSTTSSYTGHHTPAVSGCLGWLTWESHSHVADRQGEPTWSAMSSHWPRRPSPLAHRLIGIYITFQHFGEPECGLRCTWGGPPG